MREQIRKCRRENEAINDIQTEKEERWVWLKTFVLGGVNFVIWSTNLCISIQFDTTLICTIKAGYCIVHGVHTKPTALGCF